MRKIILIALVFLSAEVIAQTNVAANKDTTSKNITKKATKATAKASAAKANQTDGFKAVNLQYQDSVLKYRELAMYYQSAHRGAKDTAAIHYQKMAVAFQRKHVQLNRAALVYNDSLVRKKRKEELEKKYKVTIK